MWSFLQNIVTRIKNFFIRFFYGAQLSFISLQAFVHYKKLMIILFLAALLFTTIFMGFIAILWQVVPLIQTSKTLEYAVGIPLVILFMYTLNFTKVFFNMITVFTIDQYCQSNNASITHAFNKTFTKLKAILLWSILETIVRMASSDRNKAPVASAESFWSFVRNTGWHYLSFFIYPVFAFEQKSMFESLKESVRLMKNYFGSISGAIFSFTALAKLAPFILLGYVTLLGGVIKLVERSSMKPTLELLDFKQFFLFFLLPTCAFILWFCLEMITIAQTIAGTILYRYVHNQSTGIFSRATLEAATKER
ncbi:MAG: hypothetical protein WCE21_03575 [Candidatus Babeliales bacterium]